MTRAGRVAIIPARGGSKRIPRKNIREFCGRPMIAWSIEAAMASDCFDRVIVSTDDEDIGSVAREWGAEVPFLRPAELADDQTGILAVMAHALEWLDSTGETADFLCCLYATAPLLQPADLREGLKALQTSGADYALAVTSYAFPIQRAIRVTGGGRIAMFQPEHIMTRSQDLEEAWHDAGQFCWGRRQAWLERKGALEAWTLPVPLPRCRVQDIDTLEDWRRAELQFRVMNSDEGG